jgi:hypothetical protein
MGERNLSERRDVPEAKFLQRRQSQGTRFRNMPKRVAANVAIIRRVRQLTDAHAVENNPDNAFKTRHFISPENQRHITRL